MTSLRRLRSTLDEAHVVGDLDGLTARLEKLVSVAESKATESRAARDAARVEALARKTALVEEAERIAAESTQWKAAGDRLREILDEWKTIKGVDRKVDTELWKRVSAARSEFGRRRGAYFATLDEQRKEVAARKEQLVAEAESLTESTQWAATASRYKTLMTQWKAAGRAARDVDDALWQRFRAAQDAFFSRRSSVFAERDSEYKANQLAKEALAAEAEAVDPSGGVEAAQAALRDVQTRWSAIGRVPREVAADLDKRLDAAASRVRGAADARWRETTVSSSPLVIRLRESVDKLERKIDRARREGRSDDIAQLQSQLTTQREWLAQGEHATR
jgi:hypothetical protein